MTTKKRIVETLDAKGVPIMDMSEIIFGLTAPEIVAITIAAMAIGLAFTLALQRGGKAE